MEPKLNLTLVQFKHELQKCSGKIVALDTETTGVQWWVDKITTVGFHCPAAGIEGTIDIGVSLPAEKFHEKTGEMKTCSKKELEQAREDWLGNPELCDFHEKVRLAVKENLGPGTTVVMHNAKFDAAMLGVDKDNFNEWKIIDTAVMVHLYDSRLKKSLDLVEKKLLGTNTKREHAEQAPTQVLLRKRVWFWEPKVRQDYCVNDARVTYQLAQELTPQLRALGLEKLFLKDMEFLKVVYHAEQLGILLDQEFVHGSMAPLLAHQKKLEQQLMDSIGYKFNWRSHPQLSKALYEGCGIAMPINPFATEGKSTSYQSRFGERVKELKGGMYNKTMTSTFLLMEKVKHPLGELVASLRESAKLANSCKQWLKLVDENSTIHSNFNLTGTRTGRLSSSKPNLANVASEVRGRFTQGIYSGGLTRSDEYNLRNAFVCRSGHYMLSIDYKQQEMRMFAYISQDENLMRYVKEGKDIHLMIALEVWGDCGEDKNKIHREWSKTIAFGLLYGMTTGSLEHKLGMTRAQAQQVISDYWTTFPRIRPTLFETIEACKADGMIRYWSGRIWREETEMFMYKGMNAQVQGGSADLLSIAAIRVHKYFQETDRGNILSFVYDELLMEVKKETAVPAANRIADMMQIPDVLDLAFLTDCKMGTTYGNMVGMDWDGTEWSLPEKFEETFG